MRITLHGGASNKIKNGIGSNGPNMFLFGEKEFGIIKMFHTTVVVLESLIFLFGALFSFIIILNP